MITAQTWKHFHFVAFTKENEHMPWQEHEPQGNFFLRGTRRLQDVLDSQEGHVAMTADVQMPVSVEVGVVAALLLVGALFWLWRYDAKMEKALQTALESEQERLESALRHKEVARRRAESEEAGEHRTRARVVEAEALLRARRARADGAVRRLEMAKISNKDEIVDLEAQVARHKARTTQMKNELRLEVEAAKARDAAAARKHRAQVEAEAAATAVKVAAEREAARIRRMHAELEAHAVEIEQRTIPEVQARLVGAAAVEAEEEVDVEPQASQLDSEVENWVAGNLKLAFRGMVRRTAEAAGRMGDVAQRLSFAMRALEPTLEHNLSGLNLPSNVLSRGEFTTTTVVTLPIMGQTHDEFVVKTKKETYDEEARKCCIRESIVLTRLGRHENIVSVLAMNDTLESMPLLMPKAEGTLTALLHEGCPTMTDMIRALHGVARGVHHMQDLDLVHGDLKPDNVLIYRDASGMTEAKLCDFAFATERNARKEADTGTLGFIPVENMGKSVVSDFAQDWMSMGVILDVCFRKREHGDYMFKEALSDEEKQELAVIRRKGTRLGVDYRNLDEFHEWDYNLTKICLEEERYSKLAVPHRYDDDVPCRTVVGTWITQLLFRDPTQRPTITEVQGFLVYLHDISQRVDNGWITLDSDGNFTSS